MEQVWQSCRAASRAALLALAALWLGCRSGGVVLPKDLNQAAETPEIGARALLQANRIEFDLASWGPAVKTLLDSLGDRLDPNGALALRASATRVYGAQRLFDRMATAVASEWDPDAARAQLEFLDSRLGAKLMAASGGRREPKTLQRFAEFRAALDPNTVPAPRLQRLRRLDAALLTSRSAVLVNRAFLDAALAAFEAGVDSTQAGPFRELRARAASEESGLYANAAQEVLAWNLFTLDSLSDDELDRYAAFAESPAGQWWVVTVTRAFRATASGAGDDLFQALRPRGAY
jgi:hypothetical protein